LNRFFVMYRTADGRRCRLTLGSYPAFALAQARDLAKEKLRLISVGVDPREVEPGDRRVTFAELAAEYLERHAKRKKASWREDERRLRVELLPDWGHRRAGETKRRDVILALDRVADRGAPISANRLRALISTVFNFGIGRAWRRRGSCREDRLATTCTPFPAVCHHLAFPRALRAPLFHAAAVDATISPVPATHDSWGGAPRPADPRLSMPSMPPGCAVPTLPVPCS
jgi:hypothetical protein